jgi:hypothetical protein
MATMSQDHRSGDITEMNRTCLVLYDMNNRIFGPYLAAIDRILISIMGDACRQAAHLGDEKEGEAI